MNRNTRSQMNSNPTSPGVKATSVDRELIQQRLQRLAKSSAEAVTPKARPPPRRRGSTTTTSPESELSKPKQTQKAINQGKSMNISPFVSSGGLQRTPVMQAKAPSMENPGDTEREVKGEEIMEAVETGGPQTPPFVTPHIGNLHDSSSDEEVQMQTQQPQRVMSREAERYSEIAFPTLQQNTLSPPLHPSPHYAKDVMYDLQQQVSSIAGKLGDLEKREMVQNKVQDAHNKALAVLTQTQQIFQDEMRNVRNEVQEIRGEMKEVKQEVKRTKETQEAGFENMTVLIKNLTGKISELSTSPLPSETVKNEATADNKEQTTADMKTEGKQEKLLGNELTSENLNESVQIQSSIGEMKYKVAKPEKFDGKISRNALERWIHSVETYAGVVKLSGKYLFLFATNNLKEQALDWWLSKSTNRKEQNNEITTFEEVKQLMHLQFSDHATKEMAMPQLKRIQQRTSVMGYTNEFLRVRLNCPELPETLAVGFFIDGLHNDIKPHVILSAPSTVDETVNRAIKTEMALQDSSTKHVQKTRKFPQNKLPETEKKFSQNNNKRRFEQQKASKPICNFCRKIGHTADQCRKKAWTEKKKKEGQSEHNKETRKKNFVKNNNINNTQVGSTDSEDCSDYENFEVFNVNCGPYDMKITKQSMSAAYDASHEIPQELIVLTAHINRKKARILVDSGAGGNFIFEEYAKIFRIRKHKMQKPVYIRYADKRKETCNHVINKARLTVGKYDKEISFIVAPLAYDAILGKPWLTQENPEIDWRQNKVWVTKENTRIALPRYKNVGTTEDFPISATEIMREAKEEETRIFVISVHEPTSKKEATVAERSGNPERTAAILQDFPGVFCEEHPGGIPEQKEAEHRIELIDNAQPPCKQMHLMAKNELIELRKQLDTYLEKGWIKLSDSPFGALVLFALKKDGSKRLCIDYRALNKITKKSKYPLPRFEELQAMIGNANLFSKIDLANGYHQVPIAKEDCFKTAFRTRFGQYEWTVMPFGLTNAPATFQRLINNVLRPLQNKSAAGILDDILIFTKGDHEQHDKDIREVVKLLQKNKLYAKPKKCHFFQESVEYWGHVITAKGWTTENDKVKAIRNWPTPLPNVHAVRSFLGLCAYYRRYVENFSLIALPLYELIRKEGEFHWSKACDEAIEILKEKLTNAPILKVAETNKPFIVTTDASKYAIGAILQQYDEEGNLRPIAYESRKLKVNKISKQQDMGEVRYPTHEKEMLAIIHAAKVWRHLLLGNKVTFQTDHMPLKYLQEQQQLSDRQLRWMELLQQYDFEIVYKPGKTNVVADALSRRFDLGIIISQVADSFKDELKKEYIKDVQTRKLIEECRSTNQVFSQGHKVFLKDELLMINKDGKILTWIPKGAIELTLTLEHDENGHPGTAKLSELIRRKFWWPQMSKDIRKKTKECHRCQESKSSNKKPQGLLQPLPPPMGPWDRIAMDLITELPKTDTGKDAILTVIDTFSKYVHILPTCKTVTAKEITNLVFIFVVRIHGVPKEIVSDRDPRFLGECWQQLWKRMGTQLRMSTAFHLQTDGQSERTNRTVLQMIRTKINEQQKNWDEFIPMIELNLNNMPNDTTGYSPFFVNFNRDPRIPPFATKNEAPVTIEQYLAQKVNINHTVKTNISKAQQKMKQQADKHRRPSAVHKGDWVLLSTKNLRFRGPSKKVAPKYIGPFQVEKVQNGVTCTIKLPQEMKIFPKFHTSLLKIYNGIPPQTVRIHPGFLSNAPIDEEEVENILQHREEERDGEKVRQFLIKWKNADTTHATWEPESHLSNAKQILREYLRRQKSK